jgi:serine/threonine-protein kinase
MIELRTLGALELTSAEHNAVGSVLAQPRRAALLCYLALATPRGFHRRDTLLALFWPEYDAEQARHALRQSVYFLRHTLGPQTIASRGDEELALAPDRVSCDVWEFDAALDQGRPADALPLYGGELLAGFHISAAPNFERWLDGERGRLKQRAGEAAWALAEARERDGDAAGAVEAARRAAALAPTDETALRRLIFLLERVGDRAAAVRAYEAFAWNLEGEYELEPSAETQALVARIRAEPGLPLAAAPGHRPVVSPVDGNGNISRLGPSPLLRELEVRSPGSPPESIPVPSLSRRRRPTAIVAAGLATLLLLGLTGLYLRTQARDRTFGAPPSTTAEAAPGVAVLPFAVQDSTLATWREGLVDLVSLDLSGVAGLRAVDSRTLLARWRERVAGTETPELATALEVAERAGARYAVVGSVIPSGPDLLLAAGVHEIADRRMLGTARSQGPPDSIFALVDRLTLEILRLILAGEARDLSSVGLARASTASLPALKSYLEGEVLFRRSQFQRADEAYTRALEADSTFALARFRLVISRGWSPWSVDTASNPEPPHIELGAFADRLPAHRAAIVRAWQLAEHDVQGGRELLEREVRRHPDDAEMWYELGELYHHAGAQALVPYEEADRAFSKALELDSSFTVPYVHLIQRAIGAADTTAAMRLLRTYGQLAPGTPFVGWFGLVTELAFGDQAARTAAQAGLDSIDTPQLFGLGVGLQGRRCCWQLSELVLRKARERPELRPEVTGALFSASLAQGKAGEALEWVNDPFMPRDREGRMLLLLQDLGAAISPARLDSVLAPAAVDSSDAVQLFYAGVHAIDRERWQVLRGSMWQLQTLAARQRAAGDSAEAGYTDAVRRGLEGYSSWRRGRLDTALRLLQSSQRRATGYGPREAPNIRLRRWLSRLLVEMGRPEEALPYLESLVGTSLSVDYERGRIYEQLGDPQRAREAYALFLAPRQHADPIFQPMIREARAALRRLAVATPE